MREGYHYYEPADGHKLAHDPFNAIIAPRTIGWVSTMDSDGQVNLAPYSFFNAFNYVPPIIGFASVGYKDSVRNIEQTGEFCWNLATKKLAHEMNMSSASVSADVDEFDYAGLQKCKASKVAPPFVAQSPVVMECRKTQIVQLTAANGKPCETWLVLGEVVAVHINKQLIVEGVYQTSSAEPLLRGGGTGDYFTVTADNKFQMPRPE